MTRMMYGPTEIGKPPPGWLDPHWILKLYVAGSQPHVHLHGLQQPPVRFRQGLAKSRLGGGGDRKGSCSPNSFPLTAKDWLQHSMTASLPPLLSVITTLAPTHPDHPAKAQAVAAELKVWKSWRGMRSQRGESNPENQVGKGWKGDKQGALLRDWWQLWGQQFERASRACLPQNKHRSPTEWCSFS